MKSLGKKNFRLKTLICIVSFIIIPVVLLLLTNFNLNYSTQEYGRLKDQVELISWLFSGVMSLVAFFALFIGLMYENKLIAASKDLKLISRPYTINISEIRQAVMNFENNTSGDRLISSLFWIYFVVTVSTIYVWGVVLGFYTHFSYSWKLDFSVPSIIFIAIHAFYFILCGLLMTLTFLLNQISNYKDPLSKGYLPNSLDVCNIDYLYSREDSDIEEVIFKNSPILEIFTNPPNNSPTYELIFSLPIKMINYRFVIKLYDKDKKNVLKIAGILIHQKSVGHRYVYRIDDNLPQHVYVLLKEATGEMKIYDKNFNVIARIGFRSTPDDEFYTRISSNRIISDRERIENDSGLIRGFLTEKINYYIEA